MPKITEMFIINVDLDQDNERGVKDKDCHSDLHTECGSHFDLTFHKLNSGCDKRRMKSKPVANPGERYWLDNKQTGFALAEVLAILRDTCDKHNKTEDKKAYGKRCRSCCKDVEANLPHWD